MNRRNHLRIYKNVRNAFNNFFKKTINRNRRTSISLDLNVNAVRGVIETQISIIDSKYVKTATKRKAAKKEANEKSTNSIMN